MPAKTRAGSRVTPAARNRGAQKGMLRRPGAHPVAQAVCGEVAGHDAQEVRGEGGPELHRARIRQIARQDDGNVLGQRQPQAAEQEDEEDSDVGEFRRILPEKPERPEAPAGRRDAPRASPPTGDRGGETRRQSQPGNRISRALSRAGLSAISHSQTVNAFHPRLASFFRFSLSLSTLRAILGSQYDLLDFGVLFPFFA